MKREELETFKSLKGKLENEVKKLFDYIKEKYLDVLEFGEYSSYHHYNMNDEIIWIEYYDRGYDLYDPMYIDIPINDFLSNPIEWADNWANNIRNEKQEEKEKEIKAKENEEKEELKRLKEKYEKYS